MTCFFDYRLFGKKEEPKIEDIVKEALENLDLSEEVEETKTAVEETSQEETARDKVEETLAQEEISQVSTDEAIELDTQEPISSEQLTEFAQLLEEELAGLSQDIEETPVKGPDLAPQKGLYVNERYQVLKRKESQALLSDEGSRMFVQRKVDVEPVFGQIKALGFLFVLRLDIAH